MSASSQNQAKSALLFLYGEVLGVELAWLENVTQAKAPRRLPVVLTQTEAQQVLLQLDGTLGLMAGLLYGSGLRLMECVRLRVKDVDFERHEIVVREGKGNKDRVTMWPRAAARCICLMPWRESIRKLAGIGVGSMYFHRAFYRRTHAAV